MAASLLGNRFGSAGARFRSIAGSGSILPAASRLPPRMQPPPAGPLAMLPPLPHSRMAGVVVAGLSSYVRRHAAQLRQAVLPGDRNPVPLLLHLIKAGPHSHVHRP